MLPVYYGLAGDAWRHWCRVWEVDYEWMLSRFVDMTFMETPGVTSTRWFDATLLPKDQVSQPDTMKAMFVMGHGGNTIARMPQAAHAAHMMARRPVGEFYFSHLTDV
jgi:formate dehydrogenase major subunit